MTESEWLACTSPERMLECLKRRASDRKLRLAACACCRQIWRLLDDRSQVAVGAVERHLDANVGETAKVFAADLHEEVVLEARPHTGRNIAAGVVNGILHGAAWAAAWNMVPSTCGGPPRADYRSLCPLHGHWHLSPDDSQRRCW